VQQHSTVGIAFVGLLCPLNTSVCASLQPCAAPVRINCHSVCIHEKIWEYLNGFSLIL